MEEDKLIHTQHGSEGEGDRGGGGRYLYPMILKSERKYDGRTD